MLNRSLLDVRRFALRWGDPPAQPPYTEREVLDLLDPNTAPTSPRAKAILACAAQPSEWTDRLDAETRWRLGRVAERLPSVVYWRRAGLSLEEIGARLSRFGGGWIAAEALEAAARCIADRLNDRTLPVVRETV